MDRYDRRVSVTTAFSRWSFITHWKLFGTDINTEVRSGFAGGFSASRRELCSGQHAQVATKALTEVESLHGLQENTDQELRAAQHCCEPRWLRLLPHVRELLLRDSGWNGRRGAAESIARPTSCMPTSPERRCSKCMKDL